MSRATPRPAVRTPLRPPVRRAVPRPRASPRPTARTGRGCWPRARALLGDPGAAEDAVQETFLRAWAACRTFDPSAGPTLATWLGTIARNVAVDMLRARAVRPRLAAEATTPRTARTRAPASTGRRHRAAADGAARRAGRRSARSTAASCCCAVVRDRPYADVAAALDIPVGTVKSRVHHALRGMRRSLDRAELAGLDQAPVAASDRTVLAPDRVVQQRSAHARAPGGDMKKYAPLATLVAVVLLGGGLLVANMLSNPANQTTAAGPGRRGRRRAERAAAAATPEPAPRPPPSRTAGGARRRREGLHRPVLGQRGDRRHRRQGRQGRGLRLRRQEDRGVAGGHARRRHR